MFILTTIIDPTTKLYFCGGCRFSKDKSQAMKFATDGEAYEQQLKFGELELQIERVEG